MLIAGYGMHGINDLKELFKTFEMKDLGVVNHILGMSITQDRVMQTLNLSQLEYIKKVLNRFHMIDTKR